MTARIPVYRADGRRYDHANERGLARLEAAGLVARVVRHRKGHINRAILVMRPGEEPLRRTAYLGTRYSFQDHLEHGVCWDVKRLGGERWGANKRPTKCARFFCRC